mmetsp:Transcript_55530/g.144865  ORF Transcript_55530/g.144865 Transcript_55530/m.144865 type:complete len:310 (-) Transcript_55530:405-1334(-)
MKMFTKSSHWATLSNGWTTKKGSACTKSTKGLVLLSGAPSAGPSSKSMEIDEACTAAFSESGSPVFVSRCAAMPSIVAIVNKSIAPRRTPNFSDNLDANEPASSEVPPASKKSISTSMPFFAKASSQICSTSDSVWLKDLLKLPDVRDELLAVSNRSRCASSMMPSLSLLGSVAPATVWSGTSHSSHVPLMRPIRASTSAPSGYTQAQSCRSGPLCAITTALTPRSAPTSKSRRSNCAMSTEIDRTSGIGSPNGAPGAGQPERKVREASGMPSTIAPPQCSLRARRFANFTRRGLLAWFRGKSGMCTRT